MIEEKRQLSIKINDLTARMQDDGQRIEELKRQVLQSASVPEPQNSLRRRTVRLADEIEGFYAERNFKRQLLLQSLPAQTEEQETTRKKRLMDFDVETESEYVKTGLKARTIGIIQQLKAKGLNIGYLDAPGAAQSRLLMPEEIERLRSLAFRLDANGNRVSF